MLETARDPEYPKASSSGRTAAVYQRLISVDSFDDEFARLHMISLKGVHFDENSVYCSSILPSWRCFESVLLSKTQVCCFNHSASK